MRTTSTHRMPDPTPTRMRSTLLLLAVAGAATPGNGCKGSSPAPPPPPAVEHADTPLPETLPTSLAVAEFVGALACAECHRETYERWLRSPHGRAGAPASAETVRGDFSGTVKLADGTVSLSRDESGFYMDMRSGSVHERDKVEFALASGRQHQAYVVKSPDGRFALLPLIWSSTKEWLPLSLYQPGDLSPTSPQYWRASDMTRGCFTCHVSQAYRRVGARGGEARFVDLAINCESCHGPGAEHIRRRRARRTDDVYRSLRTLGSVDESRVCGACHGFQLKQYLFPPADDGLPQIFVMSLINESVRPDGTQQQTSYQYPAHVLSGGFRLEVMTCNMCHEPHGLAARDKNGRSATGELSNRQCTACHEELEQLEAVSAHSFHKPATRCVDCHMSYSWIGDDEHRKQRTSDHSISIPRPRETIELGIPNACTSCHKDKTPDWAITALERWQQYDATGVREWVRTIDLARKRAQGATERLVQLLADASVGTYLRLSAIDLLAIQPPDKNLVVVVEPYTRDPDPALRASAIRALTIHDPVDRERWHGVGLADSHPFVRMETFAMAKEVLELPAAAIERNLADWLAYGSPPTAGLLRLLTIHYRRGELGKALEITGMLTRIALPYERHDFGLDDIRARIENDLAAKPVRPQLSQ